MNSNKYDYIVYPGQNNGSGPSTPNDSSLCPSPSLDVDYPQTSLTHPTEEPALDVNAAAGEVAAGRADKTMDVEIKRANFHCPHDSPLEIPKSELLAFRVKYHAGYTCTWTRAVKS